MQIWDTQYLTRGREEGWRVEAELCQQPWWCHLLAEAFHRFVCLHTSQSWIDMACYELQHWRRETVDLIDVTDSPAFTAPDSLC